MRRRRLNKSSTEKLDKVVAEAISRQFMGDADLLLAAAKHYRVSHIIHEHAQIGEAEKIV